MFLSHIESSAGTLKIQNTEESFPIRLKTFFLFFLQQNETHMLSAIENQDSIHMSLRKQSKRKIQGWGGEEGRREGQEGRDIYIYLWLIHVDVQQKPTQFCKSIILQLKNKLRKIIEFNSSLNFYPKALQIQKKKLLIPSEIWFSPSVNKQFCEVTFLFLLILRTL